MPMQSLYKTTFVKLDNSLLQTDAVSKFIIKNRSVYLDTDVTNRIFKTRTFLTTGLTYLFNSIIEHPMVLDSFATIDASLSTDNIPSLLASSTMTLDVKQFNDPSLLSTYPEFYNKTIINLSPLIRKKSKMFGSDLEITDINELHKLYVRGMLTMSYNDSNGWLTPDLCRYIVQTFSIVLSSAIARKFTLNYIEQMTITFILSLYMCQLLSNPDDDKRRPALLMRCTYLGNRNSIDETLSMFSDKLENKQLTIADVCNLIIEHGPDRLRVFDQSQFYRFASVCSSDTVPTMIAFDYPPYWVVMLITALSGNKIGLFHKLKEHRLEKEGGLFLKGLCTTQSLLNHIKR